MPVPLAVPVQSDVVPAVTQTSLPVLRPAVGCAPVDAEGVLQQGAGHRREACRPSRPGQVPQGHLQEGMVGGWNDRTGGAGEGPLEGIQSLPLFSPPQQPPPQGQHPPRGAPAPA